MKTENDSSYNYTFLPASRNPPPIPRILASTLRIIKNNTRSASARRDHGQRQCDEDADTTPRPRPTMEHAQAGKL